MAITPIEVASFIPKSQEASLQKTAEMQKTTNEQMAFADKLNEDIQRQSEQTVATTRSENPEYRYDAKGKGNNPYMFDQQKKKKSKNKQSKVLELPEEHHGFDIKI